MTDVNNISNSSDDRPIGIFDSGMGGLSVYRTLRRGLPGERFVYLGDGEACPYGERSDEFIRQRSTLAIETLLEHNVKMIVVACNTATSAAIGMLRELYPRIPFVGMEPAVKPAAVSSGSGRIIVLATESSIRGEKFLESYRRYGDSVDIMPVAGSGFVRLVEEDREESDQAREQVKKVLAPVIDSGADKIVLGCTHYPFLRDQIARVIGGRQIDIVDPSPAILRRVGQLLDQSGIRAAGGGTREGMEDVFITFSDEGYRMRLVEKALKFQ